MSELPATASPAKRKEIPTPDDKRRYNIYLYKRCLACFKPYKKRIVLGMIAMGVAAGAEGGTAYIIKPLIDYIFVNKDTTALLFLPLIFIAITLIKGAGRLVQNYMMQSSGLKVLETLRDELYTKIVKLPLSYYEKSQIGMLISRILNDVAQIRDSFPATVMVVRQLLTMFVLLGIVFYQIWDLALLATLALPAAFFPFIYYGRKLRKIGRKSRQVAADATVVLQEILSGIRVIKAFSTEKQEGERFDRENKRTYKFAIRRVLAQESSSVAMELVGALGVAIVLYFGGMKVVDNEITVGTFMSFVVALGLLYDPVKKLSVAYNDIQGALASAERVFEILDSPDINEEDEGRTTMEPAIDGVEFRNVTFAYGPDSAPAINNISLRIRRGERLALVGPSGAGKSTFVNLLPRFYDPTDGAIRMNGRDTREYTLASLRKNISVVSQDNFLFNYSLRDNIAYGRDISDEAVREAARAAYAHDFIMELPAGYATLAGERGVKFSGGQKQRLTIARAIAKNAPLLILDEATSALDSESEKIVQKALENLMRGRTSIVIAHRLSTVLASDRILVMDQGRITAQGTHAELLGSCALYAKLYAMQFGENQCKEPAGPGQSEEAR
ncbi:MAG: ATP-binding cassette domain-containing protein [Deltaproteobacteria bacterium]|jgi:subfamily B ATP-binding cassette protein MsbA|nr:ATP-binding cassette domain-containing protein [Deltaproteobacteria bacterium]